MLIYIEDYLNRRCRSQAHARPLLVAVGATAAVSAEIPPLARASARVHVLPLTAPCCDPALPSAFELGSIYAEATLI